jgi:predicted Zn finger-like uncharacterized protein
MIYVSCPHCLSHFGVDRENYPDAPLSLRCAHCKNSFWLHPDGRVEVYSNAPTGQMTPFGVPSEAEVNLSDAPPEANNLHSIVLIEDDPFGSGEEFLASSSKIDLDIPDVEGVPSFKPVEQKTLDLSNVVDPGAVTIQEPYLDVSSTISTEPVSSPKQSWMELPEVPEKDDANTIQLDTTVGSMQGPAPSWDELPASGSMSIHSPTSSPRQSWAELPEIKPPEETENWDDDFLGSDPFEEPPLDDDWLDEDDPKTTPRREQRIQLESSGGFRAPSGPGSLSNHSSPALSPVELKLEPKSQLPATAQFNLGDQPLPEDSQELEALLEKQHPSSTSAEFNRARFDSRSERLMASLLPLLFRSALVISLFLILSTVFIQLRQGEADQSKQTIFGVLLGGLLPDLGSWRASKIRLYSLQSKKKNKTRLYVVQGFVSNRVGEPRRGPRLRIRSKVKGQWQLLAEIPCCVTLSPFDLARIRSRGALRRLVSQGTTAKVQDFKAGEKKRFRVAFYSPLQLRSVQIQLLPSKKK